MILLLASLALFLLLGIPVAYSLALSSLAYFVFIHPELTVVLPQRLFAGMSSYALIALPLFILMGQIMNASGITKRLINFCLIFVGRLRGGLGLVNVAGVAPGGGVAGEVAEDALVDVELARGRRAGGAPGQGQVAGGSAVDS